MIPPEKLQILIDFSIRNKNLELELKKDAPPEIVEMAKEFYWKPYNKMDGTDYKL